MNGEHLTWVMGSVGAAELAIVGSVPVVAAALFFREQKRRGKKLDPITYGIKYLAITIAILVLVIAGLNLLARSF